MGDHRAQSAPDQEIELIVEFDGEALQQPTLLWAVKQWAIDSDNEVWRQWYVKRQELADRDDQHACLFEIDRQTLPILIRQCPDLTETQRDYRVNEIAGLFAGELLTRLNDRWAGASPPLISSSDWLHFVTDLFFEKAASKLGPAHTLARTFERFAAGDLHANIQFGIGSHEFDMFIGEPDSYYVFLFAECALACIQQNIGRASWKALLPTLVKMQSYYLDRIWPMDYVCEYGVPEKRSPPRRAVIDRQYAMMRGSLEEQIYKNLRHASGRGFCVG